MLSYHTTVRADLVINPDAAAGARDVEVIGLDDINLIGGFSVNRGDYPDCHGR